MCTPQYIRQYISLLLRLNKLENVFDVLVRFSLESEAVENHQKDYFSLQLSVYCSL